MALVYPTARPYVTSKFGPRFHPVYKRNMPHNGTDYRAWEGKDTELYAVGDGIVEAVVWGDPGGGNYVRIRLDGSPGGVRDARYSHLSRIDVHKGKRVRVGEIIGRAGDTGSATAVHLHLGMKNTSGRYIDPHAFLRRMGATALDYAPSAPVLEVAPSTKPQQVQEDDMPTYRESNRTDDRELLVNAWTPIMINNDGHMSIVGENVMYDVDVHLALRITPGANLRARFYKVRQVDGKWVTVWTDDNAKVDAPTRVGDVDTLMFTFSAKGQTGPGERLRAEIYGWRPGLTIMHTAVRAHTWNK